MLKTLGWDRQCELVFDNVQIPRENLLGQINQGWEIVEKVLQAATVAKCAELAGASRATLEMSLDYAKKRIQFGQLIGLFQAVKHYFANMSIDTDSSRLIAYEAAWTLSKGLPATMITARAKSWVGEACARVTLLAHQIFGGIGFTKDYDIHLYHRKVKAGALAFGNASFHWRKISQELLQS